MHAPIDLDQFFSSAVSIRYRPAINTIQLDLEDLDTEAFTKVNNHFSSIAQTSPPIIKIDFSTPKKPSLTLNIGTETIKIGKLRPMYAMAEKLGRANSGPIQLSLSGYRTMGIYFGIKFRLEIS